MAKEVKDEVQKVDVVATKDGFYGGSLVRAGAKFQVDAGEKGSWFTKADAIRAPKAEKVEKTPSTTVDTKAGNGKADTLPGSGQHVAAKNDDLS